VNINLDVYVDVADNLTDEQTAELLARANDSDTLGVDNDQPFTEVSDAVAWLLMFDPSWLVSRTYVGGYSALPVGGWAKVTS
jgi:hypothetical protein